jgi:hypothetical protein
MQQPRLDPITRPHGVTLGGEATLDVCVMISNPVRYQSRYKLLDGFREQNDGPHHRLWIVEVAYGNRPFVVTERDNPRHLQLRTSEELWHKENALNLLFAHVLSECPEAEYFAWVDADVTFVRPDWVYETLQQLQHYDVVQMFSRAQDLGPNYEPLGTIFQGFIWAYYNDPAFMATQKRFGYGSDGHPGFAWAARKSALDEVGGLIDFAMVGGADRHMACGLIGTIERSTPSQRIPLDTLTPTFRAHLYAWQERALRLHKNVGYVDGLLNHHFHGKKKDRQYGNRWKVYTDSGFDPIRDLRRDAQGLLALEPGRVALRDAMRCYFRSRNEDSIDL